MMCLTLAGAAQRPSRSKAYRMGRRARATLVTSVVVVGTVAPAGVALAEGNFSSYLSDVRDGYRTRNWTDKNTDAAGTITTVAGCSSNDGATFYMTVDLRKDQFGPDKDYGNVDFSACIGSGQQYNWGRVGSGSFFDQIHTYSFSEVSATTFNVSY
jgi:hypothetical protein